MHQVGFSKLKSNAMAARPSPVTAKKKPVKVPPAPPGKRLTGAAAGGEYVNVKLLHTQPQGEIGEVQTSDHEDPSDSIFTESG